ncbi:MAG: hypothetical protein P4L90_20075 [Rhodopila sp.]|nr:hypothetical protein [Rhodopila sp.]
MTEQPPLPSPDETPDPVVVAPKTPRRDLVPWLYGLGFLVLAAAIVYLWQYPSMPGETGSVTSAMNASQQRLADMDSRLNRLEQRPATVTAADLAKIAARVDTLEGRVADQTQSASRLDTLSGRIESLAGRGQTGLDATKQQLDALTNRVAALEANAGDLDSVTKRLNRIARLQEAAFALQVGRPVGDLPNAPEALSRYAHAAPPTEAQLRLRFPQAERAALAAKQPDTGDAPFIGRVWEQAQGLVTIRRGDDVLVGNPSAIALGKAKAALEAGDLAGAVDAVATMKGPPGQAMAEWLAEAKGLLGARAALADMADQA